MQQEKTNLQKRIESGKPVIMAEIAPPKTPDVEALRTLARSYAGKVHALGVSDNRDAAGMSALAAASIVLAGDVEPVLHMTTRDRNRTALLSDCIGAHTLGIRNVLCTSGTHQSLLPFNTSKNVYDIDATLLLQSCKDLEKGSADGGKAMAPFCLGAVASPFADPLELQLTRLARKIFIGAQFMVTQPIFDLDRFGLWWKEVTGRGLQTRTAFIAGVRVLTDASSAKAYAEKRPLPLVPDSIIERLSAQSAHSGARAEGIRIALETIEKLSGVDGIKGFEIICEEDHTAAAEVLDSLKSKLG